MDIFKSYEPDKIDQLLCEYDEKTMPIPDMEYEPHLLISKVRKHYMEYIIKLLTANYETNQKLVNKNIYLPSAIWRCAKFIEMSAAQSSMVVQLYRRNVTTIMKELKNDTEKGKLNGKLYECLRKPAQNEKKLQTTLDSDCNCKCTCSKKKRRRKVSESPKTIIESNVKTTPNDLNFNDQNKTPVIVNSQIEMNSNVASNIITDTENIAPKQNATILTGIFNGRTSESKDEPDELMLQLEKIFQSEPNDDDLFENTLYDVLDTTTCDENTKTKDTNFETVITSESNPSMTVSKHNTNEKELTSFNGELEYNNNNDNLQKKCDNKHKIRHSKWLCEEYFLRMKLYELLDQIRDLNRKKYERIKLLLIELFGDDSDEEGLLSPLEETPEFILSCKERIAPWVVKLLTSYYVKGRIRGKSLFKALAKHLIKLIIQCSPYPYEYEVRSFISDFMDSHNIIRCEADFKEFKINNI